MRSVFGLASIVAVAVARAAFAQAEGGYIVYKVGAADDCPYHAIQDAVDAAAQHPGTDYVWIASDQAYTDQHVVVTNQDVIIEGGFTDCDDNDPGLDQTAVLGTSGHSVFEIEGTSNVVLGNLEITGANMDSSHSGGGIYFGGQGSLTLQTTWVHNNQAGYGGGIDMSPSGPSSLTMLQGTTISGNVALVSGGGVRVEGQTVLTSTSGPGEPLIYIAQNAALGQGDTGYGGGFEIIGPAVANISSIVDLNTAEYGGGIAAVTNDNGFAAVNLYATNPAAPPTIYGNQASHTGGGIYLLPFESTFGDNAAALCADNFVIDANIAQEGSAIYADVNSDIEGDGNGGFVALNSDSRCFTGAPQGGLACAAGVACNEINDNVNADVNAQPTDGATVLMQSDSEFHGSRFKMIGNQGGALIHALTDAVSYVDLDNCLFAQNIVSHELIDDEPGNSDTANFSLNLCTIADNQIGAPYVIWVQPDRFTLINSIIDQPGRSSVDYSGSGNGYQVGYVLATETASLSGPGILQGEPTFVSSATGDYHQTTLSLGVDYAPAEGSVDLDGNPRTVDLPSVPNGFGPLDLGAYERQFACAADTIFCDGFGG